LQKKITKSKKVKKSKKMFRRIQAKDWEVQDFLEKNFEGYQRVSNKDFMTHIGTTDSLIFLYEDEGKIITYIKMDLEKNLLDGLQKVAIIKEIIIDNDMDKSLIVPELDLPFFEEIKETSDLLDILTIIFLHKIASSLNCIRLIVNFDNLSSPVINILNSGNLYLPLINKN